MVNKLCAAQYNNNNKIPSIEFGAPDIRIYFF